jgi:hypothetical protein
MARVPKHTHDAQYAHIHHSHDELDVYGHGSVYVAPTRQVISGAGLTGGGDLSADRTLAVGAGTGIQVNADNIELTAAVQASLALADTAVQPAVLTAALASYSLTSHNHDHGALTGLTDDDHTQYVLRSILTTDGDVFVRSGGAIARLGIGSDGQFLKVVSGQPAWAAVSGGGGSGLVESIVEGDGINVDATTPENPIVEVDQTFAFTWTGAHTFETGPTISAAGPSLAQIETDQAADSKRWVNRVVSGVYGIGATLDDNTAYRAGLSITRNAASSAITDVEFGNATNNPTFTFAGTGRVLLGADNQELRFGTGGDDLAIYHNGTDNYIDSNTGSLYLRAVPGSSHFRLSSSNGVGMMSGDLPAYRIEETDQGSDEKIWSLHAATSTLVIGTRTDADGSGASAITITRTGTAIGTVRLLGETRIDALNSNGVVYSSTYTPTETNITNLDSVTASAARYIRIGDIVMVSGQVSINATLSGSQTVFALSLPIASGLTSAVQLSGIGKSDTATASSDIFRIYGDATNDRAEFESLAVASNGAEVVSYVFTYQIL